MIRLSEVLQMIVEIHEKDDIMLLYFRTPGIFFKSSKKKRHKRRFFIFYTYSPGFI